MIIAGSYTSQSFSAKDQPYVMLYDRTNSQNTVIKAFKSNYKITALNYGPYDNGHVLVGMENGNLLVFGAIDLKKLFIVQVF
jgi:hypothetical protein